MLVHPLFSVIVPIYNSERYLRECIDSILEQELTDFELLLIDDGSTDNSGMICDEYASLHKCVKTYHGDNHGVSAARNIGYHYSVGTYICFVDADDTISSDYLIRCKESLVDDDIDVICFGQKDEIFGREEYARRLLRNEMTWFLHHKCFRRDVFKGGILNVSSDFYIGEDLIVNIRLSQNVGRVKCLNYQGYNYRLHDCSITSSSHVGLKYEEEFIAEVTRSLRPMLDSCNDELWFFKLQYIWKMIQAQKGIKRDNKWVRETLNFRGTTQLGWNERIVLAVPSFKLCYLILMFKEQMAKIWRCFSKRK